MDSKPSAGGSSFSNVVQRTSELKVISMLYIQVKTERVYFRPKLENLLT